MKFIGDSTWDIGTTEVHCMPIAEKDIGPPGSTYYSLCGLLCRLRFWNEGGEDMRPVPISWPAPEYIRSCEMCKYHDERGTAVPNPAAPKPVKVPTSTWEAPNPPPVFAAVAWNPEIWNPAAPSNTSADLAQDYEDAVCAVWGLEDEWRSDFRLFGPLNLS